MLAKAKRGPSSRQPRRERLKRRAPDPWLNGWDGMDDIPLASATTLAARGRACRMIKR